MLRGNAPGNAQGHAEERAAVPPARRIEIADADAGRKQRLQRTRPAIVGPARQRERHAPTAPADSETERSRRRAAGRTEHEASPRSTQQPQWLAHPEPPARGETRRDKALLDLLPVGILIYRLDRLLYANPAFLERMGYASLHALEEAGGLDALYVEPGVSTRQQHLGHRHAGDDFRDASLDPRRVGGAGAPLHDFLGR